MSFYNSIVRTRVKGSEGRPTLAHPLVGYKQLLICKIVMVALYNMCLNISGIAMDNSPILLWMAAHRGTFLAHTIQQLLSRFVLTSICILYNHMSFCL